MLIAVKPADVSKGLSFVSKKNSGRYAGCVWMSIAAGVSIDSLQGLLPAESKVCRVMPNTPALIGEGVSAFALNSLCDREDVALVDKILSACGSVVEVPEKLMDAVTGVSGSGPAYVYLFIEALIDAGITAGLPPAVARQCAVDTVVGAARMVKKSNESPAVLKSRVMSPGGTTARGVLALEKNKFKYAVHKAVLDATARSRELGQSD